ncbi:MAG: GNAT family N-acetyltransferase [Acidimicrobiales bacterium]
MNVSLVSDVTPELKTLWDHAHGDVVIKRGGVALLQTICGTTDERDLLNEVVTSSSLWAVHEDDQLVAFVVCREQVVEAIYVAHPFRRKKVATTLVRTLLASATPPVDAYALPGDRAMKSLYESLGWKARLLTMRGA